MAHPSDSPLDRLWQEYSVVFRDWDDLSLARWMAQTLGQFQGQGWRLSHPLVGTYRLAVQVASERQIWLKRLVSLPADYAIAECCRAPLVPLLTRDVLESGLLCLHCNETAIEFDDLPTDLRADLKQWADNYSPVHAVAHWDDDKRRQGDYDRVLEDAAANVEAMLVTAGKELLPKLVEVYSVAAWEDHDECLDVQPEDIRL